MFGSTPLSYACYYGYYDIVNWIAAHCSAEEFSTALQQQSNRIFENYIFICLTAKDRWTILLNAVVSSNIQVLDFLLTHGVDQSHFSLGSSSFGSVSRVDGNGM